MKRWLPMTGTRLRSLSIGLSIAVLIGAFAALPVGAQEAEDEAAEDDEQTQPTIRMDLYNRLGRANTCFEEGDLECADDILNRIAAMRDLNTMEAAQMWSLRAIIAFERDDLEGAVAAYEMILALPHEELSAGVLQPSMRNLAQLYMTLEPPRLEDGLELFKEWMALPGVTIVPADWFLVATVYYQLEEWNEGIDAIQQAIQMANDAGELGQENWYYLLYVFHYELEDIESSIDVLTILVENWASRNYVTQLAGHFSQRDAPGDQERMLTLWEAAYEQGWLENSGDLTSLASMYINHGAPYKAAVLLQEGLDNGNITSNAQNWNRLAQAWQIAREDRMAIPAFEQAARLSDDGNIATRLAQSYYTMAMWDECIDAARDALGKGGLNREDQTNMLLSQCLANEGRYEEARAPARAALDDERSAAGARQMLSWIDYAVEREEYNRQTLASIGKSLDDLEL